MHCDIDKTENKINAVLFNFLLTKKEICNGFHKNIKLFPKLINAIKML